MGPSIPCLGELEEIITSLEANTKSGNLVLLVLALEPAVWKVVAAADTEGSKVSEIAAEIPK